MSEDLSRRQVRRAAFSSRIQAETAIDDNMIEHLVRGFYARVQDDDILGPIFAERIKDWEPHLQKMCDFWSSVALMSGRYHGKPVAMHIPLPVDARHFDRWLALFEATAQELCPASAANHFIRLAHRIAETLEFGIGGERGLLLKRGERLSAS